MLITNVCSRCTIPDLYSKLIHTSKKKKKNFKYIRFCVKKAKKDIDFSRIKRRFFIYLGGRRMGVGMGWCIRLTGLSKIFIKRFSKIEINLLHRTENFICIERRVKGSNIHTQKKR